MGEGFKVPLSFFIVFRESEMRVAASLQYCSLRKTDKGTMAFRVLFDGYVVKFNNLDLLNEDDTQTNSSLRRPGHSSRS